LHRHHEIEGCTAKTPLQVIISLPISVAHRTRTEIQHNFAILDESLRHLGVLVDANRQIRVKPLSTHHS
jgi:hypothetical protein